MRHDIPMNSGMEVDTFCAKQLYNYNPGTAKAVKRGYNKRSRKAAKKDCREQIREA